MGRKTVIGESEALALRRQWEREVLPRAEEDQETHDLLRSVFRCVSEKRLGDVIVKSAAEKKRDLAEEERVWWQTWFVKLGFARIAIPKPEDSNRAFARWQKSQSGLIYVPSVTREFYEQFMIRVCQGGHWTVDHADRKGIVWEGSQQGYWLRVEMNRDSPRVWKKRNELLGQCRLLSLMEYVILWHALKARTGQILDMDTWCWLRTGYEFEDGRLGALCAYNKDKSDQVDVRRNGPDEFGTSCVILGGRASEVIPNAA